MGNHCSSCGHRHTNNCNNITVNNSASCVNCHHFHHSGSICTQIITKYRIAYRQHQTVEPRTVVDSYRTVTEYEPIYVEEPKQVKVKKTEPYNKEIVKNINYPVYDWTSRGHIQTGYKTRQVSDWVVAFRDVEVTETKYEKVCRGQREIKKQVPDKTHIEYETKIHHTPYQEPYEAFCGCNHCNCQNCTNIIECSCESNPDSWYHCCCFSNYCRELCGFLCIVGCCLAISIFMLIGIYLFMRM